MLRSSHKITAALSALAIAGVTGCGSSSSTTTTSSSSSGTSVSDTANQGYFDMTNLENAFRNGEGLTMPDGSTPTFHVSNINCIRSGSQEAKCSVSMTDGSNGVMTITINSDGSSFIVSGTQDGTSTTP